MGVIASYITSLTIVYSTVYSDADQRKHPSSVSLAFVWGIHRGPVNSPHKWPVTRKMFPFDDVIITMLWSPIILVARLIPFATSNLPLTMTQQVILQISNSNLPILFTGLIYSENLSRRQSSNIQLINCNRSLFVSFTMSSISSLPVHQT